jgi:hypothetical protein
MARSISPKLAQVTEAPEVLGGFVITQRGYGYMRLDGTLDHEITYRTRRFAEADLAQAFIEGLKAGAALERAAWTLQGGE